MIKNDSYYVALGRFIDSFAITEAMMFLLLSQFSKVGKRTAQVLFSGVRVDAAMSHIKRLTETNNTPLFMRGEILYVFTQIALINSARNDIVHYGAWPKDDGQLTVSNSLVAQYVAGRLREIPISPELLDAMTTDLDKINFHLSLILKTKPSREHLRMTHAAVLQAPWLYKPPAQVGSQGKNPKTSPKRKRPRQSSRA